MFYVNFSTLKNIYRKFVIEQQVTKAFQGFAQVGLVSSFV